MQYVNELDSRGEFTLELADRVVEHFEAMLLRPRMYVGRSDSPEAVIDYAGGFESALRLAFHFPHPFIRDHVSTTFFRSRGWQSGYFTPLKRFRKGKMEEEDIVKEIIKFEIVKWKSFRRDVFHESLIR